MLAACEVMAPSKQGSALALVFFVFFCSASVVSSQCDNQDVDRTLEPQAAGDAVVKATADKIVDSGIFGDDHDFLRRLAKVESDNGVDGTVQGGIWRIKEGIFKDVDIFIKSQTETPTLQCQFYDAFCFTWSDDVRGYGAMDVPLYSALTVMVYLKSIEQTIPKDIQRQADQLWTKFLNRNGDEQEFISCSRSIRGNAIILHV